MSIYWVYNRNNNDTEYICTREPQVALFWSQVLVSIFGKGKYFQVFGCIMKIVVENIFMCLVLF